MDIHRCRFVPYPPSTINALAFSHSHITKAQKTASPRLAVGRANGDIEIWNPLNGSWLQETIIRGGKDRSVDGLVWIQDPNEEDANGQIIIGKSRLFSIGYTTTVTEWDLEKGRPLRQASGNHGDIWCLAAQPVFKEDPNAAVGQWKGQNLIAGCTDGALVIYSTKDEDLQLQKVLIRPSSKKAKIISVAFQDRNIVVAGCTDSTIRIYDTRSGMNLRNMSMGAGPKGGPKEIIVWSVKVLQNGNIVSGDSTGEVRIWDAKTYTLSQRIKGHRSDVLCLATSFDGQMIFSGGMDRRTVAYKKEPKSRGRWAEVGHRRYHKHDVKAMASLETRNMSVVISGGPDAAPTVLPLRQFGMENQRALPFLPQDSAIRSTPSKRLLLSFWDREIHIWRLKKPSKPTEAEEFEDEPTTQSRKLIAKILIKGEANITSASLSADGSLLVASTTLDIKVFQLRKALEGDGLRISKVAVPTSFSLGARLIQLSPDGKWLSIIRPDSRIVLARVLPSASSLTIHPHLTKLERITRKIEKRITLGGLGSYDRTITQCAFSSDSRILAVSDLAGYIDTFVLSGLEDLSQAPSPNSGDDAASSDSSDSESDSDSEDEEKQPALIFGHHWSPSPLASSLPKLPSTPTVLSFRPTTSPLPNPTPTHPTRQNPTPIPHDLPLGDDRLLIILANSEIYEFEVLKGGLSPWSRRNPPTAFPDEYRKVRDLARGAIWDVRDGRERAWVWGVGWLWMFDLARDFPPLAPLQIEDGMNGNSVLDVGEKKKNKKRKRKHGKEAASGAGSSIPDSRLGMGMGRKMQRVIHEEVDETENTFQNHQPNAMDIDDSGDDNDDDYNGTQALETLRRGNLTQGGKEDEDEKSKGWWWTFKYRPILGMCVIGEGEEGVGPEVALVERPIWEAELPDQWVGEQEWEKGSL